MNVMSEGGDIQRGDLVYYRGEVWTVGLVSQLYREHPLVALDRVDSENRPYFAETTTDRVQRVEQIR